jgi:hypothetical protein
MNRGGNPARDTACDSQLSVVPPLARGARTESVSAATQHDELGAAEETRAVFGVDRQAWRDDVIHPGLDRARRAEVVQRQAEQHRVGVLDLLDQRDDARDRFLLRGRGAERPAPAGR